ncbi:sensor histidine kinase [Salmonirosea aquatica]|uniref:Histidine kinase n=1 Tax=Salmonirosea aquatica TaxID=2654236 RepID=A0A7C9FZS2_9BACT|nr:histidine kinase [Cytophagaceae bacterium SJW1-29]
MDFLDRPIRLPLADRRVPLRYAVVHAAYWVLVTGFFLYERRFLIVKANLPYFLVCVVSRVGLLMGIAYLNIHYYMPRYLRAKRYLLYCLVVLLSVLAYLLIQSLLDFYLYGFVVGPLRGSRLIETISYIFFSTVWYLWLMVALKLSLDWYEQQRVLQRIAVEKLQAEVNYLRSQVNPHFLFNILNSLYALTLKKSDLAPEVVLKLSEMMGYMLYDSDDLRVPLVQEISYLQNYMELEKLRCGDASEISLDIQGNLNGQEIAPLLLLPLVENAFKHGIEKRLGRAWMHGTLAVDHSALALTVENSKPAISPKNKNGGIGLTNLRKRLELLYPGRYSLHIEEKLESYKADLHISFSEKG